MLAARRRNSILAAVRSTGSVSISELANGLCVSVSTLRRDIDLLHGAGLLERTRGGAISRASGAKTFEPTLAVSGFIASAEKRAIGQKAAELIKPAQTVLFDSGTTCLEAARAVVNRNIKFTAVTNDLNIATLLSEKDCIDIVVPGGMVRHGTPTILGGSTVEFLSRLSIDILFVGAHAAHDGRLSDTSIELAEVKRCMIAVSEFSVLLADSGKFEQNAFATFGSLTDIEQIITDEGLAPDAIPTHVASSLILVQVPLPTHGAP